MSKRYQIRTGESTVLAHAYLLVYEVDAGLGLRGPPLCSCAKDDVIRWSLWKDRTQVDCGLEHGEDVWNDVHLVKALHLEACLEWDIAKAKRRVKQRTRRSKAPSFRQRCSTR